MYVSVRSFIDSSGAETVILKMDGTPAFWPNLFATINYRNAQKSPNTIKKVLRTVGQCYQWAKSEGLDLEQILIKGDFLSIENVDSLSNFLKLKSNPQQAIVETTNSPFRKTKTLTSLESVRSGTAMHLRESSGDNYVGGEEIGSRIRIAAKYFEFHLSRRTDISAESDAFRKKAASVITYMTQLAPRIKSSALNEDLEGISEEEAEIIEQAFRPGSETNPFRRGFIQHRNYLIWRFLYETGMRRHELGGIQVGDVNYSTRKVVIRVSKTYARTVGFSMGLADFFHDFIMEYWAKMPDQNTKHGYLITNAKGKKLGLSSINLIFQTLRENLPELPNNIQVTPHTMRRTWNDRFSAKIDNLPAGEISTEQEQQIRVRQMGWSIKSEQAARYAKRHIRRKADEIAESLANELITNADNKNE